jgi:hypothetical protein
LDAEGAARSGKGIGAVVVQSRGEGGGKAALQERLADSRFVDSDTPQASAQAEAVASPTQEERRKILDDLAQAEMADGLYGFPENTEPFYPKPSTCAIPYDPNEAASAAITIGEELDHGTVRTEPTLSTPQASDVEIATNVVYAPPEVNFPVKGFTHPAPDDAEDQAMAAQSLATVGLELKPPSEGILTTLLPSSPAVSKLALETIAAKSHVFSSSDPTPRVVDTAAQVPATILSMMRKAGPRTKKSAGCPECGSLRGVHAKGCSKR